MYQTTKIPLTIAFLLLISIRICFKHSTDDYRITSHHIYMIILFLTVSEKCSVLNGTCEYCIQKTIRTYGTAFVVLTKNFKILTPTKQEKITKTTRHKRSLSGIASVLRIVVDLERRNVITFSMENTKTEMKQQN